MSTDNKGDLVAPGDPAPAQPVPGHSGAPLGAPLSPCPSLGGAEAGGDTSPNSSLSPSSNPEESYRDALDVPATIQALVPTFPHDLVPVHEVLLKLASDLQSKVDQATQEFYCIRKRLSTEMLKTAESLATLGEVVLPSSSSSTTASCSDSTAADCLATLSSIHGYRDQAVQTLQAQAATMDTPQQEGEGLQGEQPKDFNTASDGLDHSFHAMKVWLDQFNKCARNLQNIDGSSLSSSLRRFNVERCRDIDSLEKSAVLAKMSELRLRSCSLQMRKPVRSLGHTLDLQEIMLLAKNAKSLVYEVSLQMLKIVDVVKGEEIEATTTYHRLTKENSDLLRRYCFYLKLKLRMRQL